MSLLARLGISLAAMLGTAVVVAIAAAILDLFLSGHGYGSIGNEVIGAPSWGVHLSIADIALLVLAVLAGGVTWWLLPRKA